MRIEEAIKQTKPFKTAHQKAMVNLLYSHGWLEDRIREVFGAFGITRKQFNILRILNGAGKPVSTSFIGERLLDRMSDVSRIVDRLHEKEWVVKNACAKDRRLIDVSLSEKGAALLAEIDKKNNIEGERIDSPLSKLSEKEAEQLSDLLDLMRG